MNYSNKISSQIAKHVFFKNKLYKNIDPEKPPINNILKICWSLADINNKKKLIEIFK